VFVENAEGITANGIVVALIGDTDGAVNGADETQDEFGNDVTSITGPTTQTVKARPDMTSGITTN